MRIRALALAFFCTLLAGCYFDHPLTGGPLKDINSWLLGVWEHKDAKGQAYRARVVPLTGDRYFVSFQSTGRKNRDKKVWEFEGWISRVGYNRFLTLKCDVSSGEVPEGAFVFVNYQVVDQNTVVLRPLQLDSPPDTPSYELRAEVRRRLKEQSLMPVEGSKWTRVSEIYWEPGYTGEQPFQPLRFPPYSPAPGKKLREDRKSEPLPLRIPE
ncbi:MAG TPA: hypothetical protein VIS96_18515 [Terrimicrobiaceae bacterium]